MRDISRALVCSTKAVYLPSHIYIHMNETMILKRRHQQWCSIYVFVSLTRFSIHFSKKILTPLDVKRHRDFHYYALKNILIFISITISTTNLQFVKKKGNRIAHPALFKRQANLFGVSVQRTRGEQGESASASQT